SFTASLVRSDCVPDSNDVGTSRIQSAKNEIVCRHAEHRKAEVVCAFRYGGSGAGGKSRSSGDNARPRKKTKASCTENLPTLVSIRSFPPRYNEVSVCV